MKELRKLLGVPKEMRIAQHIYNVNRDTETRMTVNHHFDGKFTELDAMGIDIFYQEDKQFINKCKNHRYE